MESTVGEYIDCYNTIAASYSAQIRHSVALKGASTLSFFPARYTGGLYNRIMKTLIASISQVWAQFVIEVTRDYYNKRKNTLVGEFCVLSDV